MILFPTFLHRASYGDKYEKSNIKIGGHRACFYCTRPTSMWLEALLYMYLYGKIAHLRDKSHFCEKKYVLTI